MATSAKSFTVVDQVVRELQEGQTLKQKKSNTVTTAVGSAATLVATALTLWVEQGTSVPSWVPFLVVVLGMLATLFGVSKTKNGMTDSVADKIHAKISEKVDENHFHYDADLPRIDMTDGFGVDDAQAIAEFGETSIDALRQFAEDARAGRFSS